MPGTPKQQYPLFDEEEEKHYMHVPYQVASNPPNWKDWTGFAGMICTVAVVLLQGGKVLERLDATSEQLKAVIAVAGRLNDDLGNLRTELAKQHGADMLLDEQIKSLLYRMNNVEAVHSGRTGK